LECAGIARDPPKVANPGGRAEGGDWHDRLICEVLRREAEAYFLDRDFPADPFAR
jgi:hypothetical protein